MKKANKAAKPKLKLVSGKNKPTNKPATDQARQQPRRKISYETLAAASIKPQSEQPRHFSIPEPMPGVVPDGAKTMAMDFNVGAAMQYANAGMMYGSEWIGYPALAELSQIPEVRRLAEVTSREMTRKFIKLQTSGDEDKTDKIKALEDAFDRFKVRDVFRDMAFLDSLFGRAHLFLDTGYADDPDELMTPLILSPSKIKKGGLKRLQVVEPVWTYPTGYGSINPLKADFYEPHSWFVMGKTVSGSSLFGVGSNDRPGREIGVSQTACFSVRLNSAVSPSRPDYLRAPRAAAVKDGCRPPRHARRAASLRAASTTP